MKRHSRHLTAAAVPIDPELEQRWQDALLSRPNNNPTALAAWDRKHSELLATYQAAIERAQKRQKEAAQTRARRRRRVAAAVIGVLLATGGIAYWTNRPSEDELRSAQMDREDIACTVHYEQARHVKLVNKQIDLLHDGEGGWLELHPYEQPVPVGDVALSPAELLAGKISEAQVNHEDYVQDSSRYIGPWALLERQKGRLVLTLFSLPSGFGELPHAPLQVNTASAATVRGEKVSTECL
jgi:hypothetical protein